MRNLIVVPWRPIGEDRIRNWAYVKPYWESLGWPLVEADSGDETFNRGRSQNLGASTQEWDVLMVLDADVVVDLDTVREGAQLALDRSAIVLPHDAFLDMTPDQTDIYVSSGGYPTKVQSARVRRQPVAGGLHLISRAAWDVVQYDGETAPRGQDRRLTQAAKRLGIPVLRLPGTLVHLDHSRPDKIAKTDALRALIHEIAPGAQPNTGRWVRAYRQLAYEGRLPTL